MKTSVEISATIVLYNEPLEELKKTVNCFLQIPQSKRLFLVDNSSNNSLEKHFKNQEITYIFNNKNIGFSKANNLVLPKLLSLSKYHLILNPDVVFQPKIITELISEVEKNKDLALIAPKAEYSDGKMQFIARKYPSFFDLIIRRLGVLTKIKQNQEYQYLDLTKSFEPDFLHGCFLLFNTQDFINVKGFDERYFLYMEDVDICRKIDKIGKKKLFYPNVKITHIKRQGSTKSVKLFLHHLSSSIKYFLKWRGK